MKLQIPKREKKPHAVKNLNKIITKRNGWYALEDFRQLLKKERSRTTRQRFPISFICYKVNSNPIDPQSFCKKNYVDFFSDLLQLITKNTRFIDIKSITDDNYIVIILIDTSVENSQAYIDKMYHIFQESFDEEKSAKYRPLINGITISSHSLSAVTNCLKIKGLPKKIQKFEFCGQVKNKGNKIDIDHFINGTNGNNGNNGGGNYPININGSHGVRINNLLPPIKGVTADMKDPAPHLHFAYFFLKRAFDILGALTGIFFFSPVMIFISIVIRMTSKGPVFFKQTRVGYQGKPFTFLKFRTMKAGNNNQIHQKYVEKLIQGKHEEIDQGDASEPVYKIVNDPRITKIGHLLRKTSLDEIPQFFNILSGEMSMVGPRPPIPYEVAHYNDWHIRRIMEARPGLTGLWQIYGRNRTTFNEMVRFDLEYARNQSVWLDMKIVLKTVGVMFNPKAGM